MAVAVVVDVAHLRSFCRLCLLLSFCHAIGLPASRDVYSRELPAKTRNNRIPDESAALLPTLPFDITRNAFQRSTAAGAAEHGLVNAAVMVNLTSSHGASFRRRRTITSSVRYSSTPLGSAASSVSSSWSPDVAARTLDGLERELEAARLNCSGAPGTLQSLNVELPRRVLERFSAEAASAVHGANVIALLLMRRSAATGGLSPVTSSEGGDAFYFSFARAMVESAADWVSSATLVVQRPGRATVGPRAARFSPTSADFLRIRVSDVGHAHWYARLLQRTAGVRRGKAAGRCGDERGWTAREGDVVVNKSSLVSELGDVLWSLPYVRCPSLPMINLIVPIYRCSPQHQVIIRSACTYVRK